MTTLPIAYMFSFFPHREKSCQANAMAKSRDKGSRKTNDEIHSVVHGTSKIWLWKMSEGWVRSSHQTRLAKHKILRLQSYNSTEKRNAGKVEGILSLNKFTFGLNMFLQLWRV